MCRPFEIFIFRRTWTQRRMAYTAEKVVFSYVDSSDLLDMIPLQDIDGIQKKEDKDVQDTHETDAKIRNNVDFKNSFQISTQKGGYNAGRTYFIRSQNGDDLMPLIDGITLAAKIAKRKAASRSLWTGAQERVFTVYSSNQFQGLAAFLILAVSALLPLCLASDLYCFLRSRSRTIPPYSLSGFLDTP